MLIQISRIAITMKLFKCCNGCIASGSDILMEVRWHRARLADFGRLLDNHKGVVCGHYQVV